MFLAFSITFCDLITILTLFKSRAKFLTSRDTRRQQLGFAKQVLLQGLIFNLYMFWYTKAGDFLPGKCDEWKQFFTTTFSSNLLNIIDPMIILIFNGEYRIWMFSLASENVQRVGISSVHINSLF
ncbi:unnamed protein product [Caenorhabditis angaria]|uniref:7TM GPCR serpentine receptor class x (Srx) domain-containing protein n=1 Tax=Caenorhabditis angaria TaxID=860376 RepID=A0A9P1IZN8_9PELO|nr:unnamed protein product [Caenorhabditis angaria]